ncbi:MAG: Jag N-terminal domain-containing protein [Acidimicrobiia bacterium]|nr:Jag N-terminal domain-containing protein [Acidimicrobiia bacterium]
MEWVETTGDSITEAKAAAVDLLGIAADEAEFEIINEERKNIFGRVKDQARIRARVRPTKPPPKQERSDRGRGRRRTGEGGRSSGGGTKSKSQGAGAGKSRRDSAKSDSGRPAETKAKPRPKSEPARPRASSSADADHKGESVTESMSLQRQGEVMSEFLGGMLRAFELEGRIEGAEVDESTLEVNIAGPSLGLLVGPRGNTLRAVQELARTVVQRKSGGDAEGRVRIDVDGYRERRRTALSAFATEVADRVRETGAEQALEPMSAADRKIVHDTVTDLDGVDTISEGSEPDRRVVIVPAD